MTSHQQKQRVFKTKVSIDPTTKTPREDADRRRHIRIEVPLKARFLSSDGKEHACLVANISAGGALLRTKHAPAEGERVVIYIDSVGRFEANVVRAGKHAFAVAYCGRREKYARTADTLIEVVNRGKRQADRRITPRVRRDEPALVTLESGEQKNCAILDISLTGASIEIDPQPDLGSSLVLGRMTAKVVRSHETGVGVIFTGPAERMDDVINQTTAAQQADEN
ncbi:MAG: PilZ domain-containing protein [Parvularculaceae bacterium]